MAAVAAILSLMIVAVIWAGSTVRDAGVRERLKKRTETVWRGALGGDSVFVRATWVPTTGASWCFTFEGRGFEGDTNVVRPKYVGYTIENSHGHVRSRDVLSEPDSQQFCCDELTAEGLPWRGGVVIKLDARGWGCEPAGSCASTRFIYLARRDSVASSEWTDIPWDPAVEGLTAAWASEGCLAYPMTLSAQVRGSTILFEPTFPPEVKEGDLLEKPTLKDEQWLYCVRPFSPNSPTTIELFPTPGSNAPKRLLVDAKDRVEILSTVIRAERAEGGRLAPRIFRVGIRAAGRRGFVTPATLRSLGFTGL